MKAKNKILVVDDDPAITLLFDKFLKAQGFKVIVSDSAVNGAELMKKQSFALVITDINMPQVNGIEFLLWIKEHYPETHVIVITAYDSDETRNIAEIQGALSYLKKPIKLSELSEIIKSKLSGISKIGHINLLDLVKMVSLSNTKKLLLVSSSPQESRGKMDFKDGKLVFTPALASETKSTLDFKDGKLVLEPTVKSDVVGKLYFNRGKVINAEFGPFAGKDAFFFIMKIKGGFFVELPWEDSVQEIIKEPVGILIEESLKFQEHDKELNNEKIINNKILVVDDNEITTKVIEKFLLKKGYPVVTTDSAVKGAEILKTQRFGLIITDINMPEVNGIEFLLWIKNHFPKSQVILMTAYGTDEIREFALKKGVISYLEKPVNLEQLDQFIRDNLTETGFYGDIRDIELLDFIKIISFSRESKLVYVIDYVNNKTGVIYLKKGNAVHAECAELSGKKAFFSILEMENGVFSDSPWEEPPQETINIMINELLEEMDQEIEKNLRPKLAQPLIKENLSLVRSTSKHLEKAMAQKEALDKISQETDFKKKLTIYESGVVLGIVIGVSKKDEVSQIMNQYSSININPQYQNQMFFYDDLSLTILFNEYGTVEELNFGSLYKGKTSMGIGIGDSIEKSIEVYGKPKICTIKGAVWENIAFFSQSVNYITSIRLRNLDV